MSDTPLQLGKLYRHYKTRGLYIVVAIIKNTGDGQFDQDNVLYFSPAANKMFTRPLAEFTALVMPHVGSDLQVPRFELLSPQP